MQRMLSHLQDIPGDSVIGSQVESTGSVVPVQLMDVQLLP